jgi:hypothetical protein
MITGGYLYTSPRSPALNGSQVASPTLWPTDVYSMFTEGGFLVGSTTRRRKVNTVELNPYVTCVTSPDAPELILMAGGVSISRIQAEVDSLHLLMLLSEANPTGTSS